MLWCCLFPRRLWLQLQLVTGNLTFFLSRIHFSKIIDLAMINFCYLYKRMFSWKRQIRYMTPISDPELEPEPEPEPTLHYCFGSGSNEKFFRLLATPVPQHCQQLQQYLRTLAKMVPYLYIHFFSFLSLIFFLIYRFFLPFIFLPPIQTSTV